MSRCDRRIRSRTTRRFRRCRRLAALFSAYCWQHQARPPSEPPHYDRNLSLLIAPPLDLSAFVTRRP